MLTGIILLSVIVFVGVVSYRQPRFVRRVFKNVPLIDWINIFILPILGYFALFFIVKNILERKRVEVLDFETSSLLAFALFFLIYVFVANSIHFVGKVLSRYIPVDHHSKVYQVNEIFHGKLSHYLAFICGLLMIFSAALLEINYPLSSAVSWNIVAVMVICGLIGGVSSAKGVFYSCEGWRGFQRPLFLLSGFSLLVQFVIIVSQDLNILYYPLNIFIISFYLCFIGTFFLRRFFIIYRLSYRKRFRFLARLLSA